MKTIMKLEDLKTIDQLTDFLSGTQAVAFSVISDTDACYRWIEGELVKFRYLKRSRQGKGVVIRYLMKISGYSRQQLARLIAQYRKRGRLRRRQRTVSGFKLKYSEKVSACWQRWMSAMTHPVVRRSRSCVSGPVRSLDRRSTPRW